MFEELSRAIQTILRLKKESRFSEAEETINDAIKQFSDSDVEYMLRFTPGQLVIELTERKKLTEEKLQAVAELLYQYGAIKREQFLETEQGEYFSRSLALFRFLQRIQTGNFNMQILQRISELESISIDTKE